MVSFAPELTHLQIAFEVDRKKEIRWYELPLACLRLDKLEALSILCLKGIDTRESELLDILISRASTLGSLELLAITFMRGTWSSFFDRTRGRLRLTEPIDPRMACAYYCFPRAIGFKCSFLRAHSPELAMDAGDNIAESLNETDVETDIKPIWRWLCVGDNLHPFWKEQVGVNRFTCGFYYQSPDVTDWQINLEHEADPDGRELVEL